MKLKTLLDCVPSMEIVKVIEYGSFKTLHEGETKSVDGHMDIRNRHIVYVMSELDFNKLEDVEKKTTITKIVIYVTKQTKE